MSTIGRARAEDVREALAISNASISTAINLAIEPEPLSAWQAEFVAPREVLSVSAALRPA